MKVENLKKQLDRLGQRAKLREDALTDMLSKLLQFYSELGQVMTAIESKMDKLSSAAAVGSDEEALRTKRDNLLVGVVWP